MDLALNNPQRLICHKTQPVTEQVYLFMDDTKYVGMKNLVTKFSKVLCFSKRTWNKYKFQAHKEMSCRVIDSCAFLIDAIRSWLSDFNSMLTSLGLFYA